MNFTTLNCSLFQYIYIYIINIHFFNNHNHCKIKLRFYICVDWSTLVLVLYVIQHCKHKVHKTLLIHVLIHFSKKFK